MVKLSAPITEFQSKDYKKLKKNGICTQCKTEKAIPGQTKCEACRKAHLDGYYKVQKFKSDAKKASCDSIFSVGDEVKVEWLNQDKTKSSTASNRGYGDGGVIEHVNDRFLSIRHKSGYIFTVSMVDMLNVAIVTVVSGNIVNKKEEDTVDNKDFTEEQKLTPIECIEKGVSVDLARPMKLADLTLGDAEALLDAGISKHKLGLMYGASTGVFYRKLISWGLHKGGENSDEIRKEYTNEPQDNPEIVGILLNEAIELRDKAAGNNKCMISIRKSLLTTEAYREITEDVDKALADLNQQYRAESERIEDALAKVRVVI